MTSARMIHDLTAVARKMFVPPIAPADADVSANPGRGDAISEISSTRNYALESAEECEFIQPPSLQPVTTVEAANLIWALRQLEVLAKRSEARIAFKTNGRILFLNLADIVAVQAEGNYVSLQHRPHPYLLRESLSTMAEKLKPYGFIRIHRSVVVNISAVEEIQPLPTGEYRLRVKSAKEYLVTRRYKDNLKNLAQLWVGSQHFPG
jgi:DNA-binding LytR/AlgR family response regulator